MDFKIESLKEAMIDELKKESPKFTVTDLARSCGYNMSDFTEIAKHKNIVDLWSDASLEARVQLENEARELTDKVAVLEKRLNSFMFKIPFPPFSDKRKKLEKETDYFRNNLEVTTSAIGDSAVYYNDLLLQLHKFQESINKKGDGAVAK